MKLTPNQAALIRALQGGTEDAWAGTTNHFSEWDGAIWYMFVACETGTRMMYQIPMGEGLKLVHEGLLYERAHGVWMLTDAGKMWKEK